MSKVVHDEVPLMCNNEICAGRKNNMHTLLKVMPIPADIEKKYSWAQPYQCNICNATFYICETCKSNSPKNTMFIKSRLRRHHLQHIKSKETEPQSNKKKRKQIDIEELSCNNTNGTDTVNNTKEAIKPYLFDRTESHKYFTVNDKNGKDLLAWLVMLYLVLQIHMNK